jgi:hypothetical protein
MTVTSARGNIRQITGRIDAHFRELPGLRLTEAQVRRLCNLSDDECEAALEAMLNGGDLTRDSSGHYTRPRRR